MKILFDYFCYRKSIYLLSFLFVFIFCVVSFVYNAINDAIQYATLICFVILFIYFLYDYYQFYKKNQTLTKMIDLPEVFVSDLSLATDAIEDKYQELLVKMDQIQKTILTTNEQKYQEELREKYNPDNIFKNKTEKTKLEENIIKNETAMIEYKKSIFRILIDKFMRAFHKS